MNNTVIKWSILIPVIMVISLACNSESKVSIKGTWTEGAGQTLAVDMLNINQLTNLDSVQVKKNGKFRLSFDPGSPELVSLKTSSDKVINLLVFPGDRISLDISCSDFSSCYSVEGSAESDKIRMLEARAALTVATLDSIAGLLPLAENETEQLSLRDEFKTVFNDQRNYSIKFILENLNSLSSVYALYQRVGPEDYIFNQLRDLQYMKIVSDSVAARYPESSLVFSLDQDVKQRTDEYNNMLLMSKLSEKGVTEKGYIDLHIPDTNGDTVSLSSFQGKVILLNFWASASETSRQSNKTLKAVYDKYHAKGFEVYSVSLDNNRLTWWDAVRFEEYSWTDVCELSYPDSYAASIYNITNVPSTFLISREGNIVARNINGKTLGTWLDNLL